MNTFDPDSLPSKAEILLIKIRSIGDVVYNTSVYAAIKERWPDSRLTVVVEPPSDEIVKEHPAVDEVLRFRRGPFWKQAMFYLSLRKRRWDAAIDMHEGPRGAVMCFVSGAKWRVGNRRAKRAFLYNVRLDAHRWNPQYPVDFQAALIREMGVEIEIPKPAIYLSDASREAANEFLKRGGVGESAPFCVIHPGTKRVWDQWQYEKFGEIARKMQKEHGLKIVLTTGPGQEDQAEGVRKYLDGVEYVYGLENLQTLAAITQRAKFALCHNGGYMHLAAALGVPVIALFGPVSPRVWKPQGSGNAVMYTNLECSPCNNQTRKSECYQGDAECKRLIEVEDVVKEAEKILNS